MSDWKPLHMHDIITKSSSSSSPVAGTVASPWYDLNREHTSINQQVGGRGQNEPDPATSFLGDLEDVSRCDQEVL